MENQQAVVDHINDNTVVVEKKETDKETIIDETAKLIKNGWTLTADSCPMPKCISILLRNKDKQQYCVSCKMWCIKQTQLKDDMVPSSVSSQFPSSVSLSSSSSSSTATHSSSSSSSSSVASSSVVADPVKKQSSVPAPFDEWEDSNDDFSSEVFDYDKPIQDSGRLSRMNEVSKKLGEKMMSGWTMLDIHCPADECACPLMRDKSGLMLCVSCGSEVKHETSDSSNLVVVTKKQEKEKEKEKDKEKEKEKEKGKGKS